MNCKQGDIVLFPFPFSNLAGQKKRPAIIISNKVVNKTQDIVLAMVSGQNKNDEFSFALKQSELTHNLPTKSEVRCHRIFTADKNLILKKLSALKKPQRQELLEKISSLLSVE